MSHPCAAAGVPLHSWFWMPLCRPYLLRHTLGFTPGAPMQPLKFMRWSAAVQAPGCLPCCWTRGGARLLLFCWLAAIASAALAAQPLSLRTSLFRTMPPDACHSTQFLVFVPAVSVHSCSSAIRHCSIHPSTHRGPSKRALERRNTIILQSWAPRPHPLLCDTRVLCFSFPPIYELIWTLR